MSDRNKQLVKRLIEDVFNKGDQTLVDELLSTDYVYREPTIGEKRGRGGYKEIMNMYRSAFPDAHIRIDEQISEGDYVVTRWTATGTQRGELMGIAPTQKKVSVQGITIARIANGRISEDYETYDALGMMRQLGVVQALKAAA